MLFTICVIIFRLTVSGCVSADVFGDSGDLVSVMEGDSVILHTDTEIQSKDVVEWRFEENLIAKYDSETNVTKYVNDSHHWNFRNRLVLNNLTGDLTIKNLRAQESGRYHMDIIGARDLNRTFNVHCRYNNFFYILSCCL